LRKQTADVEGPDVIQVVLRTTDDDGEDVAFQAESAVPVRAHVGEVNH